ncbi:MFS transporter [Prochlorococcus sp. MIT 1306]|uniref:MFS transporter n=1 Tax=Prochlorococcus sp. MIT 1306 TaxID=1799667 RepID=UPI002101C29C|nr:MFS transporter [Prochlorococcus sp. MIT 1306]
MVQSSIADVVKPEDRGRWFGYIYVAVSTTYVVGPLFGGMMTDANLVSFFGPSTPFWAAAILAIVSLACSLLIFREPLPVEI